MSKKHGESHAHSHDKSHRANRRRRAPHKDWRLWVVVAIMLGAMVIYLLTIDESEGALSVPAATTGEP